MQDGEAIWASHLRISTSPSPLIVLRCWIQEQNGFWGNCESIPPGSSDLGAHSCRIKAFLRCVFPVFSASWLLPRWANSLINRHFRRLTFRIRTMKILSVAKAFLGIFLRGQLVVRRIRRQVGRIFFFNTLKIPFPSGAGCQMRRNNSIIYMRSSKSISRLIFRWRGSAVLMPMHAGSIACRLAAHCCALYILFCLAWWFLKHSLFVAISAIGCIILCALKINQVSIQTHKHKNTQKREKERETHTDRHVLHSQQHPITLLETLMHIYPLVEHDMANPKRRCYSHPGHKNTASTLKQCI